MRIGAYIYASLWTLWVAAAALAQPGPSISLTSRDSRAVMLAPGAEPVLIEFTADPGPSGGDAFHVIVSRPGVVITLVTPSGNEIDASNAEAQGYSVTSFEGRPESSQLPGPLAMPGFHTILVMPAGSAPGSYQIKATPAELDGETVIQAIYNSRSTVRAAVAPGRAVYAAGDAVVLTGIFFDESAPLPGVNATVRIRPSDDPSAEGIDLALDDAGEVDATVGDGLYFGVWRPESPGRYLAAMKATGTSISGVPFSRVAGTEFRVLPPLARIESIRDSAVDDDGDGRPDRIVIELDVDVSQAGEYQARLNLRAAEQAVVTGRTRLKMETGKTRLEVAFSLDQLSPLRVDGPYAVTDVFLIYLSDPEPPVADERAGEFMTAAYPLTEFLASGTSPVEASSSSVSFGDVQTDSSRELALTLRNRSNYPFTERVLGLAGDSFSVVAPAMPFAVPPGGEIALRIRFRPIVAGQRTATLAVAGLSIALSGNGIAPRLSVTPARLDFGQVTIGQTKDLSVTVRNVFATPQTVNAAAVANDRFRVLAPAAPFTIGVGQQQIVNLRFTPNAAGPQSGVLRLAAVDIPLTGTGHTGGTDPSPPPPDPDPDPEPPAPDPGPAEFRITSLEPSSTTAGEFGFTLTVNGSGFIEGAKVRWNTVDRPTTFVSSSQLRAAISRTDIANPGSAAITVASSGTLSTISNALSFPIAPPPEPSTSVLIQQIDRSQCPTIRVFASVLSPSGAPVERAPSARFACSENGSPVTCQTSMATDSTIPASIALILPTNGLGSGIEAVRAAASNLIARMGEGDRAAIIHLQTQAAQIQAFTSDRTALNSQISLIREVGEGHALLDAVNYATSLLASEAGRRQAIFLLTHRDNQGGTISNPNSLLSTVRTRGIPIYSLAFGAGLESATLGSLLKSLTLESQGVLVTENSISNLTAPTQRLAGILRAQYATTYNAPANESTTFRLSYIDSGTFSAERIRPACAP